MSNVFNLERFKSKSKRTMTASQPKRRGIRFVMLPVFWIEKLRDQPPRIRGLADDLLVLNFRYHGQSFKLGNQTLKLPRATKRRALGRLESLGLITVQREGKSAPLITVVTEVPVP